MEVASAESWSVPYFLRQDCSRMGRTLFRGSGRMRDLPIYVAMGAFLLIGVGALARPTLVTAQFGMSELTAAGRNEVRAVYGGFGVLMAGVLVVALQRAELRGGILLTLACALGGMAAGRARCVRPSRGRPDPIHHLATFGQ